MFTGFLPTACGLRLLALDFGSTINQFGREMAAHCQGLALL